VYGDLRLAPSTGGRAPVVWKRTPSSTGCHLTLRPNRAATASIFSAIR